MRVVIVTGERSHHKNLCVKLAASQNVVGILHPAQRAPGFGNLVKKLRTQAKRNGWALGLLRIMRRIPAGNTKDNTVSYFKGAEDEYRQLPRDLIYESCDVHSAKTHEILRSLRPDVAVCLGGPVYPRAFIDSCPLMLNFHSGVSPIYNGTSSIQFAFANGHIQFCGGTLLVINAVVDGGGIIGHFLPAIEPADTPEILFQKTVAGAPGMYERLLNNLAQESRPLTPIPQSPPLFYTRDADLGWHVKAMTASQIRRKVASRFLREERAMEYWRATDSVGGFNLYRETIETLLWGMPPVY